MPAIALLNLHDDGGVRPAQQLGQNHAGLREAVVVRLQPGEDQIEVLVLDRRRKGLGGVEGVERDEAVAFQMDGAIGALGQGLAQYLLRARRAAGDDHHFSAVLLFLAQRLFQRVGVRLVHFVGNIFANPRAALVQLQRRVFLRDLLHADQDLHPALLPLHDALNCVGKRASINERPEDGKRARVRVLKWNRYRSHLYVH